LGRNRGRKAGQTDSIWGEQMTPQSASHLKYLHEDEHLRILQVNLEPFRDGIGYGFD